jgi:hypothetical protein
MSGTSLALASALEAASLIGIFSGSNRSIGPIIPGIVIEEDHEDTLTITEHPVEQGAAITDHAFKNPSSVTIQCMWSNTQASLFDFSESYVQGIYQQLIALQNGRQPITIVTGKRMYQNMLLESITTQTTNESAYSLPVTLECKQIIIVQTSATTLPPQDQHITPQQTAPVIDNGSQSPTGGSSNNQSYLLSASQAGTQALQSFGVKVP